ncbi:site-specific DNA-methyltransferase [Ignatzschineria indica]|uniref:site-specific DNA-methyltransferase n=1 Tax=Ignatzschineria indica TaxID=472583 RepID=UPI0025788539|nr:site-specific DNA-methyltransferase [Ignatzschineria indica]MDM1544496.1 site-specific DNA-methyltransferase [Ignatzschineria indica]
MSKLKMMSPDLTAQNIDKIAELFPAVITEVAVTDELGNQLRDEAGNLLLRKAIDFDLLKQELSASLVEGPVERYQLDWPGKRESLLAANAPIAKTLRPAPEESVDFESTENLFIEGDNLEALKLLQESYLGKVKMIYIDPPYNTGNDFVYNDDFAEDTNQYLERSLQKDEEGNRLVANPNSKGRYHSDWLSMMNSRLRLARNLLSKDGLILISIGDEELNNIRSLASEIYGENNYYGTISWTATTKAMNAGSAKYKLQKSEEYILVYGRVTMQEHSNFNLEIRSYKKYPDINDKGRYRIEEIQQRKNIGIKRSEKMVFPILGIMPKEGYRWTIGAETARELEREKDVFLINNKPMRKIYQHSEDSNSYKPLWINFGGKYGTSEEGKALLELILEKEHGFETVKPINLIIQLAFHFTSKNDLILDFFAGSSTTAHAVMQLNAEDGGNRKFIMVQLPEATDEKSEAYKAGYQTIAEISKERIRRAGKQILESDEIHEDWNRDIGFRVFKVDSSNMKEVYYQPQELTQADLLDQVDNVKEDRTPEDLLFQVMLDWGLELSLPITTEEIEGKKVFFVDGDALIACFDAGITESLVQTLAAKEPLRLLFRDNHYLDNDTKINAEQLVKQIAPNTELKSI